MLGLFFFSLFIFCLLNAKNIETCVKNLCAKWLWQRMDNNSTQKEKMDNILIRYNFVLKKSLCVWWTCGIYGGDCLHAESIDSRILTFYTCSTAKQDNKMYTIYIVFFFSYFLQPNPYSIIALTLKSCEGISIIPTISLSLCQCCGYVWICIFW